MCILLNECFLSLNLTHFCYRSQFLLLFGWSPLEYIGLGASMMMFVVWVAVGGDGWWEEDEAGRPC